MTIDEFLDLLGRDKVDEIWVKDRNGNYITAKGNQKYYKAEVDNCKYPSVVFTM